MNRAVILLIVSVLTAAAAAGQSNRRALSLFYGADHGWLGVSVQDVTKKLAEREGLKTSEGAYVSGVLRKSPAAKAGILEGDVIVKFGSREITGSDDLIAAVRRSDPGDEVTITVNRGGETKTLTATIDETETPRAFSYSIPSVPSPPSVRLAPFSGRFFRSGESLGLGMEDLGKQLAEYFEVPGNRGVLVTSVDKNSAAAKAGFMAGDVIVSVNRNSVRDVDDVLDELRDAGGETVPVDVVRKGKPLTFQLEAGKESDETSFYEGRAREEFREALRNAKREAFERKGWIRDLKEGLRELEEELRENARELGENLREAFRSI